MSFKDKVVVVTGGNKGIGRGVALGFAKHGAKVAISARSKPDLDSVAAEIKEAGGTPMIIECDVTNQDQVDNLAAQVLGEFGAADVLVNNAGIAMSHKFIDHPDDIWNSILDVNLTGTFRVSRAFSPMMIENGGGRIIMMASVASKAAGHYMTAYTTSKHGLIGLTRSMALELNKHHITVNAICPGYVDTPMSDSAVEFMVKSLGQSKEDAIKYLENTNPQKRLFQVEEIAHLALMLADEDAKGITGQAINIDGGTLMH